MILELISDYWLLLIGFIILGYILFRFFKPFFTTNTAQKKGYFGEKYVLDTLNHWAESNNLSAKARRYRSYGDVQEIDLVFEYDSLYNVGIEVKYRTAENLRYLLMEHISRTHQNSDRQSSRQLYEYLHPNHMLGLYAFVFVRADDIQLHFLPHYILEEMIRQDKKSVRIEEIILHPHGYKWNYQNTDFIDYVKVEHDYQQQFVSKCPRNKSFYPNKNEEMLTDFW